MFADIHYDWISATISVSRCSKLIQASKKKKKKTTGVKSDWDWMHHILRFICMYISDNQNSY